MRFRIFNLLWLIVFMITACDPGKVFESNVRIPDSDWYRSERAKFTVDITDTISGCDMYINVRNNSDYRYMELWLFIDSFSPQGYSQRDTIKIMLADDQGRWLGNGLGDKFDNRILFRKNIRFPVSGTYIFELEQGMRDEPVGGIEDIGVRIEKSEI